MTYCPHIKAVFSPAQYSDPSGAQASYALYGDPTTGPVHIMLINTSFDNSVYLSTDGVTDMLLVPSGNGIFSIDFGANKEGTSKLALPVKTQMYLKQGPAGAPTSGEIVVTFVYGE